MSLKGIAKETLDILEAGGYVNGAGERVDFRAEQRAAVAGTVLYTPEQGAALLAGPGAAWVAAPADRGDRRNHPGRRGPAGPGRGLRRPGRCSTSPRPATRAAASSTGPGPRRRIWRAHRASIPACWPSRSSTPSTAPRARCSTPTT